MQPTLVVRSVSLVSMGFERPSLLTNRTLALFKLRAFTTSISSASNAASSSSSSFVRPIRRVNTLTSPLKTSFSACGVVLRRSLSSSPPSSSSSPSSTSSSSTPSSSSIETTQTGPIQHPSTKESDYSHPNKSSPSRDQGGDYLHPHPIWKGEYLEKVQLKFRPTDTTLDKLAYATIWLMRFNFDWITGYSWGKLTVNKCLNRIVFLESVAGVPGSVAGTLRHLASLRRLKRDYGWIHTLWEEAENERMHLLVAMKLKHDPSPVFRASVFISQGVFFNFFWIAYLISPKFCHRLVGYLEEQAVVTYDHIISKLDSGELPEWSNAPAPELARTYWRLGDNATIRDVLLMLRADEAHHRDVNHTFADIRPDEPNPYKPGH